MNYEKAYRLQRNTAKHRGIAWEFDYESWLAVWTSSGHLNERGRTRGKYVMARPGDVGPYSPSNVEIIPHEVNTRDCRTNHPVSTADLSARAIGLGRGWTLIRRGKRIRYQVSVAKKYVGSYRTESEADAAYAAGVAARLAGFNPTDSERSVQELKVVQQGGRS